MLALISSAPVATVCTFLLTCSAAAETTLAWVAVSSALAAHLLADRVAAPRPAGQRRRRCCDLAAQSVPDSRLRLSSVDVGGVLDDLEGLAVEVEDRVVGSLDPDFLAALADPLVLGGLVFAVVEVAPELLVSALTR